MSLHDKLLNGGSRWAPNSWLIYIDSPPKLDQAMKETDLHGRLAAHLLLISFAIALATRHDPDPVDALEEVLESMKGKIDVAETALPISAPPDYAERFIDAFNSELDSVRSMATNLLATMQQRLV